MYTTAAAAVTVLESVSSPLPRALSYPDRASFLWMMRGTVFRTWIEW
jgi:hypothetical protein